MGSLPQHGLLGGFNSLWRRNAYAALEAIAMTAFATPVLSAIYREASYSASCLPACC